MSFSQLNSCFYRTFAEVVFCDMNLAEIFLYLCSHGCVVFVLHLKGKTFKVRPCSVSLILERMLFFCFVFHCVQESVFVCFVFHCVWESVIHMFCVSLCFESVVRLLGVAGQQAPLATGASVWSVVWFDYTRVFCTLCYTHTVFYSLCCMIWSCPCVLLWNVLFSLCSSLYSVFCINLVFSTYMYAVLNVFMCSQISGHCDSLYIAKIDVIQIPGGVLKPQKHHKFTFWTT